MHKTHQLFEDGNAQNSNQEIDNQTVTTIIRIKKSTIKQLIHFSQIYFNVLSQLK